MAQIKADRVKELTTTIGTGNIVLGGPATGYRSFSSVMANNDTCYYAISHVSSGEWETGYGTLIDQTTFARSIISSSSNNNTWVNFSPGTKEIAISITARQLEHIAQAPNGSPGKLKYDQNGWIYSTYYEADNPFDGGNLYCYGRNLFTGMPGTRQGGGRHSGISIGNKISDSGFAKSVLGSILIGSNILNNGETDTSYSVLIGEDIISNGTGKDSTVVAIGASAHNSIGTMAISDVSIGYASSPVLGADFSGNYYTTIGNTSVGERSLLDCFNGSYNVAIGSQSGKIGETLTQCIFIGYNSKSLNISETNSITIGANSTSKGSNTTVIGNSLITECWLYGKIIPSGGIQPASMTDASASNNTIYYSTTAGKLVYKDSAGNVNNLY